MRLALATIAVMIAAPAQAEMLPHRAVYEVTLDEASERSGITGIKGRMVYETRGSACEGISVRFRFFQNVRTPRREYTSDQRTTTFESADGKRFDFVNRTYFNGKQEKEVKGSAARTDAATAVALEQPGAKAEELEASIFPTAHLAAVIEAAKADRRILVMPVFDGSDDADRVMSTNAVIGRANGSDAKPVVEQDLLDKLDDTTSWPVTIAYFDGSADASGEQLPVYQVSFPLFENGVSGDLTMRYEDYTLKAKLTDLEFLEAAPCG